MDFDKKSYSKVWEVIGFVVMYLIFTTILYFLLGFLNKIPETWNYFYIAMITMFIVLLGTLIKMLLRY